MCMKNVNISLVFAEIVADSSNNGLSLLNFNKPISIIEAENNRRIPSLSMAIVISATQTKDKDVVNDLNPEQIFIFNENYEIKIRLTETTTNSFKDLQTIRLEPSKTSVSQGLCKEVYNFTHLCVFKDIFLPKKIEHEKFVIKILIRRLDESKSADDGWAIQTIYPLDLDK